jgi:hypothetical protein
MTALSLDPGRERDSTLTRSTTRPLRRQPALLDGPRLDAVLLPQPKPLRRTDPWPAIAACVSVAMLATGIAVACFAPDHPDNAESLALNASSLSLALGFIASDLSRVHRGGVTAITAFSAVAAATALANIVGLLEADGPLRDLYFIYAAEDYLVLAAQLQWALTVFPVLGFWLAARNRTVRSLCGVVPEIRSTIPVRAYTVMIAVASVLIIFVNLAERDPFSGEVTRLLVMLPNLAVFTLARIGAERHDGTALRVAVFIALLEALRALMYGYVRGGIAAPLFAYICGVTLGARSLRPLLRRNAVPVLLCAALFVRFYGLLGEARGWYLHGPEKVRRMWTHQGGRDDQYWLPPQQTVLARLTSFNQLSQIGRVVERDGHYRGKTFEYLRYAFVPRFLWPEKPRIALGAWYALTIGQAVQMDNGWFNNSVNMTQAGELYLNFGWPAVPIGLVVYGFLLGVFWTRARFWESDSRNVLGGALALHLLWMVLGAHGEFTVFVSLLAVYLLLLVASRTLEAYAALGHLSRMWGLNAALWFLMAPRLKRTTMALDSAASTGDIEAHPADDRFAKDQVDGTDNPTARRAGAWLPAAGGKHLRPKRKALLARWR